MVGLTDQEKILQFLRFSGPTLPAKAAKHIQTDTLLASAHLADLVSQRKVKVSNLKVGGSPLYYLPGQEERLLVFAAGNLNPKDMDVLDLLQKKRLLRENDLDLLPKVALRSLKDFAIPLQVTVQGKAELFWKWHQLSDEETQSLLQALFRPPEAVPAAGPVEQEEPKDVPVSETISSAAEKPLSNTHPLPPVAVHPPPAPPAAASAVEQSSQKPASLPSISRPPKSTLRAHPESAVRERSVVEENLPKFIRSEPSQRTGISYRKKEAYPHREKAAATESVAEQVPSPTEETKASLPAKEKISRKKMVAEDDTLLPAVERFFQSVHIILEQKETLRKHAELNVLAKVPSPVGEVTYFCKVRRKKRCDEKDISAAYVEAQMKKLPLLFLYTDELTKKAEALLKSAALQNVVVKKIG